MAAILPTLFGNLTDRVGFRLVDDVMDIQQHADSGKDTYLKTLQEIVTRINEDFAALEVSIFLENAQDQPGLYVRMATQTVWKGENEKSVYRKGEGATGFVIENGRTVRIVDLAHYEDDQHWIQREYKGINWGDSLAIVERARQYFRVDSDARPPISWVCAPIKNETNVYGVIRCAGVTRNPFYFDAWQARFLEATGLRLAWWWQNYLRRLANEREVASWEELMRGFESMNRFVQKQLNRFSWDETGFFREAMRLAHRVIPDTDNSEVRLVDENELVTVATLGTDWPLHDKSRTGHYSLKPPGSAASYLVSTKSGVQVYNDVNQAPHVERVSPDCKKLILAPIEEGEVMHGVLCIRSKSPRPFPANAGLVAGLLGQQLGLYHDLAAQIRNLKEAERRNRDLIATQAKTIGDVHHQVKSPVISSYRIAQNLANSRIVPAALRTQLEQLRGMCSKVTRVVRNMGMFADLSNDKPIRINRSVFMNHRMLQILREFRADHQSLIDPDSQIAFRLDESGFLELTGKEMTGKLVEGDWALLEQCVNNIMDNAAKYSYDHTAVIISGGVQARGTEFYISVVNEGFEVKPEDVPKLKRRGYRGDKAISATGEGSGIGLWIVDEIMRAHGGSLTITPIQNGRTDVRLVFPIVKGVGNLSDAAQNSISRG
jgi:signal transduction histidine kinase